jgi:hypothetical protein
VKGEGRRGGYRKEDGGRGRGRGEGRRGREGKEGQGRKGGGENGRKMSKPGPHFCVERAKIRVWVKRQ